MKPISNCSTLQMPLNARVTCLVWQHPHLKIACMPLGVPTSSCLPMAVGLASHLVAGVKGFCQAHDDMARDVLRARQLLKLAA